MAELQHVQDEMNKKAKEQLEEEAILIRTRGLEVDVAVSENNPVDAITVAADADPDTLIAISTHGRSGVGRWMLGSVTDKERRAISLPRGALTTIFSPR